MPKSTKKIIKQSIWVLCLQLIGIELIILFLYLSLRTAVIFLDYTDISSPVILQLKISEAAIFIILSVIQAILIMTAVISWTNESFLIHKNTLTHKRGLVTLKEDVYYLNNIQDLQIRQGFLSRLFNFGSVKFFSPDIGRKITIMNVPNPKEIGDLVIKLKSEIPPSQTDNILRMN